jgi:hypothetical protein
MRPNYYISSFCVLWGRSGVRNEWRSARQRPWANGVQHVHQKLRNLATHGGKWHRRRSGHVGIPSTNQRNRQALFLLLVSRSFGSGAFMLSFCPFASIGDLPCAGRNGSACLRDSEASMDLDEPGDKVIVLKKRGRNLSHFRLICCK